MPLLTKPETLTEAIEELEHLACSEKALLMVVEVVGDKLKTLTSEHEIMREALEELSYLGNGDKPGNSLGNTIALRALERVSGRRE